MIKKQLMSILMFACFAISCISIIAILFPTAVDVYFPGLIISQKLLIATTILSIIGVIVFGKSFIKAKEAYEFNEFGSRKKNAKRHLSSDKREIVEAMQLAANERILSSSELAKATHKGSTDPEEDLDKLIGMPEVKQKVNELRARMEFDISSKKKSKDGEKETHHMVFYGPPGTGKTTVARIITGLFYDYGYIDKNKVIEVDGNFLKSTTAADTEKKVRMILSKAYGGVLFVDEAYALTQSRDAAGKQAIATLIKEMEDNRDKFIAIFAGYPDEMEDMLNANPGFRSRVKDYIEFADYDNEALKDIAILMFKGKGFQVDEDAFEQLFIRIDNERKSPSWGNARTIRNIVEDSIDNHAINYQSGIFDKKCKYIIMPPDIKTSATKHI